MAESKNALTGIPVWGGKPAEQLEESVAAKPSALAGIPVWGQEPSAEPVKQVDAPRLLDPDELAGVTREDPIPSDAEQRQPAAVAATPAQAPTEEEDDASSLDEFMYFFRSGENDVTNAARWLESKAPLGKFYISFDGLMPKIDYQSPDEVYGAGFMDASEEVRRIMISNAKAREIEEDFPEFVDQEPDGGVSTFLGLGAKMIATPTTLFAAGKGAQGLLGMGALFGAEYEVLEQLADNGEIKDWGRVGQASVVGGTTSLVLGTALNKTAEKLGRISAKKRNRIETQKADEEFDVIYEKVVELQASGKVAPEDLPVEVGNRIGKSPEEIQETLAVASKPFIVPTPTEARQIMSMTVPKVVGQSNALDRAVGVLSSRIARYSPPLAQKLQRVEGRVKQATYRDVAEMRPVAEAINKQLPNQYFDTFQMMIFDGSFDAAKGLLQKHTKIGAEAIDKFSKKLQQKYDEAKEAGLEIEYLANMFPRRVRDRDGLRKYLGADPVRVSQYNKAADNYARKIGKKTKENLSTDEVAVVLNSLHTVPRSSGGKGAKSVTSSRLINEVDSGMLPFYERYDVGLYTYLEEINRAIHTRKILGGSVKKSKHYHGEPVVDIEDSVFQLIAQEKAAKRLALDDIASEELAQSLRLALSPPKDIPGAVKFIQSMTYLETIGNYGSTVTQLADLPHNLRSNGFYPMLKSLLNPESYKTENVDRILGDLVSVELGTPRSAMGLLDKSVDAVLSSPLTFFKKMDKLTKGTYIQGAFENAFAMAKTQKGIARLREDYGLVYGDEFYKLVQDLKARKKSPMVEEFLFIKASEIYPTSRLETLESVLNQPMLRLATLLKNYTLKSIYDGVVRRGIIENVKKGRKAEAAKSALQLMTVFVAAEATVTEIKDFMFGRGFSASDIREQNFADSLYRVAGVNEFLMDRYASQGDIKGLLGELVLPPFITVQAAIQDAIALFNEEISVENSELVAASPVIGRFYKAFGKVGKDGETQSERMRKEQDRERAERALQRRRDARARVIGN